MLLNNGFIVIVIFCNEYIELIRKDIYDNFNYYIKDEYIFVTTPIISTHTGEAAVGILIELA